jgi:hypothetical protein
VIYSLQQVKTVYVVEISLKTTTCGGVSIFSSGGFSQIGCSKIIAVYLIFG